MAESIKQLFEDLNQALFFYAHDVGLVKGKKVWEQPDAGVQKVWEQIVQPRNIDGIREIMEDAVKRNAKDAFVFEEAYRQALALLKAQNGMSS